MFFSTQTHVIPVCSTSSQHIKKLFFLNINYQSSLTLPHGVFLRILPGYFTLFFFSVFLFWLQPSFIVEASVHMAQEIVKLISGQDPVLQAMRETALNTIKQSGALISARLVYYKNMALFPDRKCQGCKDGEMLVRSRNCEVDTF